MKKVLREKGDYKICMVGSDFNMYKGEELLLTSMSLNKVDRFWNELMMMCDD